MEKDKTASSAEEINSRFSADQSRLEAEADKTPDKVPANPEEADDGTNGGHGRRYGGRTAALNRDMHEDGIEVEEIAETGSARGTGPIWKKKRTTFFDNHTGTDYSIFVQAVVILFTSLFRAIAFNVFIVPNKIAPGGVSGLSSIIYNLNPAFSVGLTSAVMNIPLVILAFLFINKKFAFLTMLSVVVTSVLTDTMKGYLNVTFTGDLFVAGLVGGMLNGVALGFLLKINSSTGGTDILGLLIQNKLPDLKISWIIFIFNAIVTMIAGIVFKSLEVAIYSVISVLLASFATDFTQKGFISSVEFKIFTTKDKERIVADYVITVLGHSVTKLYATGMFRRIPISCLLCVVRKRQAPLLKKAILAIDPDAFFYITSVSSVMGKGFVDMITPRSKL